MFFVKKNFRARADLCALRARTNQLLVCLPELFQRVTTAACQIPVFFVVAR